MVKEWDLNKSKELSDTSIGIRIVDGKVYRVLFITDKLASVSGSYYTGRIDIPQGIEVDQQFVTDVETTIKRVAQGSHKLLKEKFNTDPVYHKMTE